MPNVVKRSVAPKSLRKAQRKAQRKAECLTMTVDQDEPVQKAHRRAEDRILGVLTSAAWEVACETPAQPLASRRAAADGAYLALLNTVAIAAEAAAARAAGFETLAEFEADVKAKTRAWFEQE
jgi:hypothetical protein